MSLVGERPFFVMTPDDVSLAGWPLVLMATPLLRKGGFQNRSKYDRNESLLWHAIARKCLQYTNLRVTELERVEIACLLRIQPESWTPTMISTEDREIAEQCRQCIKHEVEQSREWLKVATYRAWNNAEEQSMSLFTAVGRYGLISQTQRTTNSHHERHVGGE